MPNTYFGLRHIVFRPVICKGQPQSEPGTARGTPIVRTTGFPSANWNTRRAAMRPIVRGAANDVLILLSGIVSGRSRKTSTGVIDRSFAAARLGDGMELRSSASLARRPRG